MSNNIYFRVLTNIIISPLLLFIAFATSLKFYTKGIQLHFKGCDTGTDVERLYFTKAMFFIVLAFVLFGGVLFKFG
ncbi:MAG TPA: hypothetical protein DEP65_01805, partial [Ruminococcus sp.]|nr:hypothetical protein [Ruminococcus sp.]